MPLIVIQFHSEGPVERTTFISYLDGLTITTFDISFDNPDGMQIGEAQYLSLPDHPLGKVSLLVNSSTRIFPHCRQLNLLANLQL